MAHFDTPSGLAVGSPVDSDRVGVVVLTWNDGDLLKAAVSSVLESTGVEVEVVVVDNGSEPQAVIDPDPRVRLIRNESNRGVAPARNQGVSATEAPLVLFLDSDARLSPGSLRRLREAVMSSPDVAMAAPVFSGQPASASAGRAPSLGRKLARFLGLTGTYALPRAAGRSEQRDVDFAIGACQLVRRTAFDEVGGLDEVFFYGPEDVDMCLRLRKLGWRVVQVGDAGCDHPARRRNRKILSRRGLQHGYAVGRLLWRHRGFSRRSPESERPSGIEKNRR